MSNSRFTLARIGASAMTADFSTAAVAQPASPSAARLAEPRIRLRRSSATVIVLARRAAHEIHLADLDADMAQDRVGRGGVEEQVRQREAEQVLLALEVHVAARRLHHDVAVLAAVD